ncbi:ubiquinol-cytochrome c reductase iron-sulfur subunit [Alkalinema pantanalense CENA528]|uniref:QcrA and Rieske domain-containing protein n=1 Tax=Alkalinema pantanalense TaxID=1620705 RepID=UPI003D6FEF3B
MNRREFVSWVGLGWIASSLPVAIAACSSQPSASTAPSAGSSQLPPPPATTNAIAIGEAADLDKAGFIKGQAGDKPVVAVKVKDQITAVNPTCTHKGCVVDWKADQQKFVCPCHGATYAADGSAPTKPASNPLATYAVKVEGGKVLVET